MESIRREPTCANQPCDAHTFKFRPDASSRLVHRYLCTVCGAWARAVRTCGGQRPLELYRRGAAPIARWFDVTADDCMPPLRRWRSGGTYVWRRYRV